MANENQAIVGMPFEVYQRQKLAEELANAPKLDEVQPGGVYRGTDGKLHDANGGPVKKGRSADAGEGEGGDEDDLEGVELTPAAREKALEAGLTAADFKGRKKSGATGFTVDDVEKIAEKKQGG